MKLYIYGLLFLVFYSCKNVEKNKNTMELRNNSTKKLKMKTLGLIGGVSWHSTIDYYSFINQSINDYYGNNTNPPLLVYTLNQAEVHKFQRRNEWDSIAVLFTKAAKSLNNAGANAVMFCANTPHKIYNMVQEKLDFRVLHIADATAKSILSKGLKKVGFIGTKYTMMDDFITHRIADSGIKVLVPEKDSEIVELHRIIIEELTYGDINKASKKYVLEVLDSLVDKGAEGIILGCTEFPLMIFKEDLNVPIFNTTEIHAMAGVDFILNNY